MVYTSPTKVARIVEWKGQGITHDEIAKHIGIRRTTVGRILTRFEKSGNYYHIYPRTGHPRKLDIRDMRVATRMLARSKAANATEVQKKAFQGLCPDDSASLEGTRPFVPRSQVKALPF